MSDDGRTVEKVEQEGFTLRVRYDEDASDPRPDYDHLGTMVCWHTDYCLGDYQLKDGAGRGCVKQPFDRSDFKNMTHLARYLTLVKGALAVLPLYLYDHSGLSISAGRNPFTFDTQGWDTSMVGYIYTTPQRVAELCGTTREPYHTEEWLVEQMRGEVEEYDNYLRGNVFYFVVTNPEGKVVESVGGWIGDSDDCLAEGKLYLQSAIDDAKADRQRIAQAWASTKVQA